MAQRWIARLLGQGQAIPLGPPATMEEVQTRRLLSASIVNGVLVENATSGADTIDVYLAAGGVEVRENTTIYGPFPTSNFTKIQINCGDGSDTVRIATAGDFLGGGGAVTKPCEINGDLGDDSIHGGDYGDTITGDAGDDTLFGGDGADFIYGGYGPGDTVDTGEDWIFGEAGYGTIEGNAGNDHIFGGDDGNQINGGLGNDEILGGSGDDVLTGYDGADTLWGLLGNDDLTGGYGDDELHGDAGNDTLFGNEGYDTLDGGSGADSCLGGDGDDTFISSRDNDPDTLDGGNGTDALGLIDNGVDTVLNIP